MAAPMQDLLVHDELEREERPREGTALCLSGGGYRAMVFHAGVLRRLNEVGYLPKLDFVSSVSGGSITAGILARAWKDLRFEGDRATNLEKLVLDPVRAMAGRNLDVRSVLGGLIRPGQRISDRVAGAYSEHLFQETTLQDLPDHPRFVFCATNLQTASLVRFSKKYVADYRLGVAPELAVPLATAVAASSAFPPYLSPVMLRIPAGAWDPTKPQKLKDGIRDPIVLSDGGVYDNLGLEPVIKRCAQILVSDGGGYLGNPSRIPGDWMQHLLRVFKVTDNQVRSLRKRVLVAGYRAGDFTGAYWSIRSDPADYPVHSPIAVDPDRATELAAIKTRLTSLQGKDVDGLLQWGDSICDTAMRSWVLRTEVPSPRSETVRPG
jgi:NTE family protein